MISEHKIKGIARKEKTNTASDRKEDRNLAASVLTDREWAC